MVVPPHVVPPEVVPPEVVPPEVVPPEVVPPEVVPPEVVPPEVVPPEVVPPEVVPPEVVPPVVVPPDVVPPEVPVLVFPWLLDSWVGVVFSQACVFQTTCFLSSDTSVFIGFCVSSINFSWRACVRRSFGDCGCSWDASLSVSSVSIFWLFGIVLVFWELLAGVLLLLLGRELPEEFGLFSVVLLLLFVVFSEL